jgi:hypothetical protein
MAPLKENLKYQLKKHHLGRDRAVVIRDLTLELLPIRTNDRELRAAIRELNGEGVPILTSIHPPYGVYYASSEDEVADYLANLGARAGAIHKRMADLSRIRAREFLRGQMELFE